MTDEKGGAGAVAPVAILGRVAEAARSRAGRADALGPALRRFADAASDAGAGLEARAEAALFVATVDLFAALRAASRVPLGLVEAELVALALAGAPPGRGLARAATRLAAEARRAEGAPGAARVVAGACEALARHAGWRSQNERDVAWLASRARGETPPPADPARPGEYDRLERALAGLPVHRGDPGFGAKVLVEIDRRERRARALWVAGAALVAAVAYLVAHRLGARRGPAEAPRLDVEVASGGVVRGGLAARGDVLRARASLPGEGELRVYADGALALRCPGDPGCGEGRDGGARSLRGEVPLSAPGRYEAVLVAGRAPAPRGGLEADVAAARAAGAAVVRGRATVAP